jgi:hypothetical protein
MQVWANTQVRPYENPLRTLRSSRFNVLARIGRSNWANTQVRPYENPPLDYLFFLIVFSAFSVVKKDWAQLWV